MKVETIETILNITKDTKLVGKLMYLSEEEQKIIDNELKENSKIYKEKTELLDFLFISHLGTVEERCALVHTLAECKIYNNIFDLIDTSPNSNIPSCDLLKILSYFNEEKPDFYKSREFLNVIFSNNLKKIPSFDDRFAYTKKILEICSCNLNGIKFATDETILENCSFEKIYKMLSFLRKYNFHEMLVDMCLEEYIHKNRTLHEIESILDEIKKPNAEKTYKNFEDVLNKPMQDQFDLPTQKKLLNRVKDNNLYENRNKMTLIHILFKTKDILEKGYESVILYIDAIKDCNITDNFDVFYTVGVCMCSDVVVANFNTDDHLKLLKKIADIKLEKDDVEFVINNLKVLLTNKTIDEFCLLLEYIQKYDHNYFYGLLKSNSFQSSKTVSEQIKIIDKLAGYDFPFSKVNFVYNNCSSMSTDELLNKLDLLEVNVTGEVSFGSMLQELKEKFNTENSVLKLKKYLECLKQDNIEDVTKDTKITGDTMIRIYLKEDNN